MLAGQHFFFLNPQNRFLLFSSLVVLFITWEKLWELLKKKEAVVIFLELESTFDSESYLVGNHFRFKLELDFEWGGAGGIRTNFPALT